MHKENCTVSFVMSERVLNMNNVIYNSGSYQCLSHQAGQLSSPSQEGSRRGMQIFM